MIRRILILMFIGILATTALAMSPSRVALAQGPSDAIFDAVFADLSARTGAALTWRSGLRGSYSWEEIVVNGSNLGCPSAPDIAPGKTRVWKIDIRLDNIGNYSYHVATDNTALLLCAGTGLTGPAVVGGSAPVAPIAVTDPAATGKLVDQPPSNTEATTYQAPIIAYVSGDGNVRITSLGINPGPVAITGDAQGGIENLYINFEINYTNLVWSPDGAHLAFMGNGKLYLASSGADVKVVASGIYDQFTPAFSPDGTEVAYVVATNQPASGIGIADPQALIFQVQAVPVAGGQPRVVGALGYGIGCGGGGFSPSVALYFYETGYQGTKQNFYWRPDGFLHSSNCTGIGVTFSAFSGQPLWQQPLIGRVSLSPDATKLAGLQFSTNNPADSQPQLFVVDASTGALTEITVEGNPDQVAWSGDGSALIYSTQRDADVVSANTNGSNPGDPTAQATIRDLSLRIVPLSGGAATTLYTGRGAFIGNIVASPTTAVVAFTLIESEEALINLRNAGASRADVNRASPRAKLGIAALSADVPGYPYFFDGMAGRAALGRTSTFTAKPAPVAVSAPVGSISATDGNNPLGLLVGGKAIVPAGGNVNVRTSPSIDPANVAGIYRPGDLVTIVQGPVIDAAGLRWWQCQRDLDGLSGWVVDQYRNANGALENNLIAVR
jgi:hypothetical protein